VLFIIVKARDYGFTFEMDLSLAYFLAAFFATKLENSESALHVQLAF